MDRNAIQNITPEFLSMIKLPDKKAKKLNYLLVMPRLWHRDPELYGFQIGFAYISSALKSSGRNVFTLNLQNKVNPYDLLKSVIINKKINVLMVGGVSNLIFEIKEIIENAKKVKPNIITVVGGVIVSSDPIPAMIALENADYGVIGEGEITVNALAYNLEKFSSAADVNGVICYRDNGWVVNSNYTWVPDLDILPFPDYEGFEYEKYLPDKNHTAIISTSRVCPYNCTFCYNSKKQGEKYRRLSIDKVFMQLDWTLKLYPQLHKFLISDELFCHDIDYAIEFSRLAKPYNLHWNCRVRANTITKEFLLSMKDAGCKRLLIGIESASNTVLKSMQKGVTIEQIEEVLSWADEIGVNVVGNLIFGDQAETMDTVRKSINWWKEHKNHIENMWMIGIYPGSNLYEVACERGIVKDRVEFIKDRLFNTRSINLSKLTDDEYNLLPSLLLATSLKHKLENTQVKKNDDYSVNIKGQCPHCSELISINSFQYVFWLSYTKCPMCENKISVNPIEHCDFDKINNNAKAMIKGKKAAVWPIHRKNYYWVLESMPVLKSENVVYINSSDIIAPRSGEVINMVEGKRIYKPIEILKKREIDIIIVPSNPKVYDEIRMQCEEEYPKVKQVVHITDLLT